MRFDRGKFLAQLGRADYNTLAMNFDRVRKLTNLLKMLKGVKNKQKMLSWLRENKDLLRSMNPQDLDLLRERAEYDEEGWQEILKGLLS